MCVLQVEEKAGETLEYVMAKAGQEYIEKSVKKGNRLDYIGKAVRQWIMAQGYVKLSSTRVCHCESCGAERQI